MLVFITLSIPVLLFVTKFPITLNIEKKIVEKKFVTFGESNEDLYYYYKSAGSKFNIPKGNTKVKVKGPFKLQIKNGFIVIDGFTAIFSPLDKADDIVNIRNNIGEWTDENLQNMLSEVVPSAWSAYTTVYLDVKNVTNKKYHQTYMTGLASDNDNSLYNEPEKALQAMGIDLYSIYIDGNVKTLEEDVK